jgi:hypothetical protein
LEKLEMHDKEDVDSTNGYNGDHAKEVEAAPPGSKNPNLWAEMEALSACALALEKAAEKALAQRKAKEEEEKKLNKMNEDEIVQAGPGPVAVINEVTTNIQVLAPQASDQVAWIATVAATSCLVLAWVCYNVMGLGQL